MATSIEQQFPSSGARSDAVSAAGREAWRAQARGSTVRGALIGVIALHITTLAATYAGVEPHPSAEVTPFIAATIASGLFALPLAQAGSRLGYASAILFGALSIVGFALSCILIAISAQVLRNDA